MGNKSGIIRNDKEESLVKKVLACLFSIILLTGSILPVYAESIAMLPTYKSRRKIAAESFIR